MQGDSDISCRFCGDLIAEVDRLPFTDGTFAHLRCYFERLAEGERRAAVFMPASVLERRRAPAALTPEERMLFLQCAHEVAFCSMCSAWHTYTDLVYDVLGAKGPYCPKCRRNMVTALRVHLLNCGEVSRRLSERSRELIKQSLELRDASEIALIESEIRIRRQMRRVEAAEQGTAAVRRPPSVTADDVMTSLRGHFPGQFCVACVAMMLGGRLIQTRELLMRLVDTGEVRLRTGTCQSCTGTTVVLGQDR